MISKPSILIIGLGNKYRRDDGAGLYVAERIKSLCLPGVKTIDNIADNAALIQAWSEANDVYIVDCTRSGNRSGYIYRFDGLNEPIPEDIFARYSTHAISIADAIELAKTLGEIPGSLIVYGIEGADFGDGEGLTFKVKEAAEKVAQMIEMECKNR